MSHSKFPIQFSNNFKIQINVPSFWMNIHTKNTKLIQNTKYKTSLCPFPTSSSQYGHYLANHSHKKRNILTWKGTGRSREVHEYALPGFVPESLEVFHMKERLIDQIIMGQV